MGPTGVPVETPERYSFAAWAVAVVEEAQVVVAAVPSFPAEG